MKHIICAVCRKKTKLTILYESTFDPEQLKPSVYTSRRTPDQIHFRIVRCLTCGLTFSDPIYDSRQILRLYKSSYNPTEEDIYNSAKVYTAYLKPVVKKLARTDNFLDIGCGDGFFLKEAKKLGFKNVYGIEPSKDAVKHLVSGINRKNIVNDVFKKRQFKKNYFDMIVFFQVFDHLLDPNKFLRDCRYILKPGGYVVAIMHNAHSWQAKILGEKMPIFDIQHIYLFDPATLNRIFKANGFGVETILNSVTLYSLGYWLRMAPLPSFIKKLAIKYKNSSFLKINIPMKVGNMAIIAKKPI